MPPSAPELLSPAGDWDAMRAAVANGADAVYFGLSNFNARHRATNFTLDQLPEVIAYLHAHNVRGYVTFNTLIFSDELPAAVDYIAALAAAGVDAVIVQDLGLAKLLHVAAPTLPIHGSTQMTLTDARGIDFVRRLGVERVILARELATADIERITAATSVPVEAFVHGALCVSYSGQCLTSESLGGRSANRGQCAQACRLPYQLIVNSQPRDLGDKAYLLSPQDLAAHDAIDRLTRAGVQSFKIEGRLKSAHYVAATTQTYRAAIDAALHGQRLSLSREQLDDLAQSFSRGFTHGFLDGVNHQQLVHGLFPKSRGVRAGTVVGKTPRGLLVQTTAALKPGDGVVFDEGHPEQDEQGGRIFALQPAPAPPRTPGNGRSGGPKLPVQELVFRSGDVNLASIAIGSIVWKTDDPALRRRLERSFSRDQVLRRLPLRATVHAAIAQPLRLILTDDAGHRVEVQSDQPLEEARKHPLSEPLLREQFGRLGDTPFELTTIEIIGDVRVMAPKSLLNDLRRRAVQLLQAQRDSHRSHTVNRAALDSLRPSSERAHSPAPPRLTVLVRTLPQLEGILAWPADVAPPSMVYCDFEDIRLYRQAVAAARTAGMPIALATLRVLKPHEDGLLRQIADCAPDAILVRNLSSLVFYRDHTPQLPLVGDYSLNVANELTANLLAEAGLSRLVPSYDLNWAQLRSMLQRIRPDLFEVVVHQHMPMFHMEHCVFAASLSNGKDYRDCGRPCETNRLDLRDRVGVDHPVVADVGCRNTVFNGAAQSAADYMPRMLDLGVLHFRVELLRETPDEARDLALRYARILTGQEDLQAAQRHLRVLHQLGVTHGTLDFE